MKFGRKVPMPSMIQIKHGLRKMAATDALVAAVREMNFTPEELSQLISVLAETHGIPPNEAQMLSARFGAAQRTAATVT
ncbi:hypothetical protein [Methylobacterium durans]|uniref:hypothetical protein n=1 Tax=Methylobacterium durans TaxID=2202825 RepID=UPI0013A553CB|nr:hypothetical protein [Methylobacterium durans]